MAGHEDEREIGKLLRKYRRELGALHLRHQDVGEHQVETAPALPDDCQALSAIPRLEHEVPLGQKNPPQRHSDAIVVINEEDGTRVMWGYRGPGVR